MLQPEATVDHKPETVKVEFDNFEHGFPPGFGPRGWRHLAYAVAIAFACFQLYVAARNDLPSQVVRGVHVGFLILLTFGLIGNFTARTDFGRAIAWITGALGFLCGLYQWIFYADLIQRDGDPTYLDLAVGTLLAVLIFEGTRRLMGPALPIMCGVCLLYWFFGQYLPAPFNHRGYDFDQVVTHLSFGTEGFYGAVVYATLKALIAIALFGMVAIGFLYTRMSVLERVIAFAAAVCLLGEFPYSDYVGFVITALIVAWQWRRRPPREAVATA